MALSFQPRPPPTGAQKRGRAVTDVDGERSCLRKKKRRLRLFLITSRLSLPFSQPATNIIDRGSSKIAVWAKQKALGRNLLRKAAILNRIRRESVEAKEVERGGFGRALLEQEKEQRQFELAKLEFIYGSHDTHSQPTPRRPPIAPPTPAIQPGEHFEASRNPSPKEANSAPPSPPSSDAGEDERTTFRSPNDAYCYEPPRAQIPRRNYLPLPPSPLGLSNYDALDLEDDIPDRYSDFDEDDSFSQDYDDEMGEMDPRSPSANTSASLISTTETGNSDAAKTPPQASHADFNVLDPEEAVVGDYDGVDGTDGVDPIWPSTPPSPELKKMLPAPTPASSEPKPILPVVNPNFSNLPPLASSSNHPPTPPPTCHSPNFPPIPVSGAVERRGFWLPPLLHPHFPLSSPLLAPLPPPPPPLLLRRDSFPPNAMMLGSGVPRRSEMEIRAERERQQRFMFLHFHR